MRRLFELIFGSARDVLDPHVFHRLSLIAFLAWVGLGADGLSSSAYGPEEAYLALGRYTYLALPLALSMALTVFIISYAYSRIIEHFPSGGGGYVVATSLISDKAGLISGCALVVDYVLTITTSVASGVAQVFNFVPESWGHHRVAVGVVVILLLVILNIRGTKESVQLLVPIFLLFLVMHVLLIVYGIGSHVHSFAGLGQKMHAEYRQSLTTLGLGGVILLFLRAFSLGGSSYTGIEAVSNGLGIMREPRVETGKRTMVYMATSLSVTLAGILVLYLLFDVRQKGGMTLNGVLCGELYGTSLLGRVLSVLTLFSEAALLTVAAQAGFVDGPRVMANMAVDSWLPHRFAALSDKLTMANGVLLMGGAALGALLYTRGSVAALVVMYSINVFITFTLSQIGMSRFWIKNRGSHPGWRRHLPIHIIGAALCLTVLCITVLEKFTQGGWITLVVTAIFIALCYAIRLHYRDVYRRVKSLDEMLAVMPAEGPGTDKPMTREGRTAVILVASYSGLGLHTLLGILRQFPGLYKQLVFISVAVVDSGCFKGAQELDALRQQTAESLEKYVALGRRIGLPAESMMTVGTDVVDLAEELCKQAAKRYPNSAFFSGRLVFRRERWYERLLHNEMAYSIQRRLQWEGLNMIILPIRVMS